MPVYGKPAQLHATGSQIGRGQATTIYVNACLSRTWQKAPRFEPSQHRRTGDCPFNCLPEAN